MMTSRNIIINYRQLFLILVSLLSLGDGVHRSDPSVLVVYRPLPVLGQLLPARTPELAESAIGNCLLHLYRGSSLVILVIDDHTMHQVAVSQNVLLALA